MELRKEAHLSSPKVAKMSLKWKERVKEKRENREAELEMQTVFCARMSFEGLDNKSVWKYMGNLGAVVYIQGLNSSTLLSLTSHDRVQSEENLSEFYQLHKDD